MELNQVEVVHSKKLEWRDTPIIPIGDLQIQPNRELFDEKRFRQVIKWGIENDARFIGLGDYTDFGSPSNRARLKSAMAEGGLYDSTIDTLDAAAAEHLGWLTDILEPTKGKWLGLLEGHHGWDFQDGTTTDTRLANFLGCRFLGTAAYVNVSFPVPPSTKKQAPSLTIWAHHGRAGQTPGDATEPA